MYTNRPIHLRHASTSANLSPIPMSSSLPPAVEHPPTDFQRPTLGYATRLGELFDERTSRFLGVQLYEEKSTEVAVTNVKHTDLTLALSNSFEKKATLLDIQASLSLEVLGGLVKAEGSASYLNDAKCNSQAQSWTLVLKVRTEERRLLFAEKGMATNVLDMVKKDYIAQKRATHFVSSIIYGGNLIINMTERATEVTNEESIEGKLGLELNQLKGAVSLNAKADAKIKAQFEGMNSKFDLVVHGDVELESVPVKPADVLDVIPEVARLLLGDPGNGAPKGVPILVTLQPIPKTILDDVQVTVSVYGIRQSLVNEALETFAQLEDVRNRFRVLTDGARACKDFIPTLWKRVLNSASAFKKLYVELLQELSQYLKDIMATGKSDVDVFPRNFSKPESEEDHHSTDSGSMRKSFHPPDSFPSAGRHSVLDRARYLYQAYIENLTHTQISACTSAKAPATQQGQAKRGESDVETLTFLEKAFLDFQFFVHDVRRVVGGRPVNGKSPGNLSTLVDISRVLRQHSIIHLFIMTPLDSAGADLAVIRFLALLRKYKIEHTHILYIEDPSQLQKLSNDAVFSGLKEPAYYVGKVDNDGNLSWQRNADGLPGGCPGGSTGGSTGGRPGGSTGGSTGGRPGIPGVDWWASQGEYGLSEIDTPQAASLVTN
ncbi:hypothetical protein M404DRAFT_1008315 [Pisolithus tinctorius Marx 270]|uniref:SNTX MACPF/CDC-like domain-containing protein n=1 Tax=Pisolithus tinctorius Marx 270 TaxID=870435 RepID=A0A0C3J9V7_PISTI|nr:hypothetical protein M404DRAFT_1008315 [Pisolithus tinctorius Marx 270]